MGRSKCDLYEEKQAEKYLLNSPLPNQYRRNVAFNLSSMEENDRDTTIAQTTANR